MGMKLLNISSPRSITTKSTMSPLLFSALVLTLAAAAADDTLLPGKPLQDGEYLFSSDGTFKLGFFTPGNSNSSSRYLGILYNRISFPTAVWVANRDKPVPDSTGVLSIFVSGNLSITDSEGRLYWSTPPTNYFAETTAKLLPDGNFVVSAAFGFSWQSFEDPTDTMLPGMKLGYSRGTSRLPSGLTSWKSLSDPAKGNFSYSFHSFEDLQLILANGTQWMWRAGLWVGERFNGIPQVKNSEQFNLSFSFQDDEVYYTYNLPNKPMISRLMVQPNGMVERLVWKDDKAEWSTYWSAPKDSCDNFATCGENSVCDATGSSICRCLDGFDPNSPENWALRLNKEGCKRRTKLDCRTDGFNQIENAKIPDTSAAVVRRRMGIDECSRLCKANCSCMAYSAAEIKDGRAEGCIHWSGALVDITVYSNSGLDLFVRVAHADLDSMTKKKHRIWIAIMTACAAAILLLGFAVLFLRRRRKRNTAEKLPRMMVEMSQEEKKKHEELDLPLFDLNDIAYATNNFFSENKLGEGGYGPVYKGLLEDEREVAVKRLGKGSLQGLDEFMNEVGVIAKLQHRNLVRLLGCCIEGEERILVYEFMPNGSLDSIIFNKIKSAMLDWSTKLQIVEGIARGLLYLHQDSRLRIIHRDLKTGNILLDSDMIPKISDFGMARVFFSNQTEGVTHKVVGTYGYMAPEYAMDGSFSVKSDVFSFGVIVLEIISGRKNRAIFASKSNLNLLREAWNLWVEGKEMNLADTLKDDAISEAKIRKYIKVGLLCVQELPHDRPEMAEVVFMLKGDMVPVPHPKPPGFVTAKERVDGSSNSGTVNNVTISDIPGR